MNKWQILAIIVDLLAIAVVVGYVYVAVKQGFIKSFFKYMKMTIVILLTIAIGASFVGVCEEYIVADRLDGKITSVVASKLEQSAEKLDFDIVTNSIPDGIQAFLPMEKIENYFDTLEGGTQDVAQKIGEKIEDTAINVIAKIVAYLGTFILMYVICTVGIFFLEKWVELPVFKGINKIFGCIWGLSHAYVFLSLAACVLMMVAKDSFIEATFIAELFCKYGLFTH